ncbi:CPB2 (predicted), partial [Pycnogonum litorale]
FGNFTDKPNLLSAYERFAERDRCLNEGNFETISEFNVNKYYRFENIMRYLEMVEHEYQTIARLTMLSYDTEEGNSIPVISISNCPYENVPVIFFICGEHAREWISPATCLYMIHQLVTGYEQDDDDDIKYLLQKYEFQFAPILNPDGYRYTWEKNRLWRKNRRWSGKPGCVGVDLNRNWDIKWEDNIGSSPDPCHLHLYKGPNALSEPETLGLKIHLSEIGNRLHQVYSMHSYGQIIATPYAFKKDPTPDHEQLSELTRKAVSILNNTYGKIYDHGAGSKVLGVVGGSSIDYIYEKMKVKYSFVIELAPRDNNFLSFLYPSEYVEIESEPLMRTIFQLI